MQWRTVIVNDGFSKLILLDNYHWRIIQGQPLDKDELIFGAMVSKFSFLLKNKSIIEEIAYSLRSVNFSVFNKVNINKYLNIGTLVAYSFL